MTARTHAILVTPVLPHPGGSGRALRAWSWLLELSQEHDVHVVVAGADPSPVSTEYPATHVWWSDTGKQRASRWVRIARLLWPLMVLRSRRSMTDWPEALDQATLHAMDEALAGKPTTRIIVFRLYLHDFAQPLFQLFPSARTELDMDDRESCTRFSVASALLRLKRPIDAFRWAVSGIRYALLERFLKGSYQRVWLASRDDANNLHSRLSPIINERPNRVPAVICPPPIDEDAPLCILFIGTLDYPPNEEAVTFILQGIIPILEKQRTDSWRILVIGNNAPAHLRAAMRTTSRILFVENPADVAAWYACSHIVLVPIRSGGGTKLKALEGFSYRRPVISTIHGVRGLSVIKGQDYMQATSAAEFADAIGRLSEDRTLADRLADAGWHVQRTLYDSNRMA